MIILPEFDPNIFTIFGFGVRWYSLAYIIGIISAWWILYSYNQKEELMTKKALDDILLWVVLGIIFGGRIGYVLFYNLSFYLTYPGEMMAVWRGGMSFHGGLIGFVLAIFLFCRKNKIPFLKIMDIAAITSPIGIFCGRIANFINLELYGRVSDVPWAMVFPNGGELPRHPSQLYEAFLEGIVALTVNFCLAKFTNVRNKNGFLSGLFLCEYAFARFIVEFFREPDSQLGFVFDIVTMGQLLSLPMFLLGVFVMIKAKNERKI